MQIKPISALKRENRPLMLQGLLSKIKPFLDFHIDQQAVITISLKRGLPKIVLASMIMSSGGRFESHCIPVILAG
jgi:hypothetical protein